MVRSISSLNREFATPVCLLLASPVTMMNMPGKWSRTFGIYRN